MAITMKEVRAWLDAEEVDYANARKLGPEAIPFLMDLVHSADLALASKATYLASLIQTTQSTAVLEAAATRNEPLLRVAAASGIRNLPEVEAEKVMDILTKDTDPGIRKQVLKSAQRFKSFEVESKIQKMADTDPEPFVRKLAASTVDDMKRRRHVP